MKNALNFNRVHYWSSIALVELPLVVPYKAWVPKWVFYVCCCFILNRVDKCFECPFAVLVQFEHSPGDNSQTSSSANCTCFPHSIYWGQDQMYCPLGIFALHHMSKNIWLLCILNSGCIMKSCSSLSVTHMNIKRSFLSQATLRSSQIWLASI